MLVLLCLFVVVIVVGIHFSLEAFVTVLVCVAIEDQEIENVEMFISLKTDIANKDMRS